MGGGGGGGEGGRGVKEKFFDVLNYYLHVVPRSLMKVWEQGYCIIA